MAEPDKNKSKGRKNWLRWVIAILVLVVVLAIVMRIPMVNRWLSSFTGATADTSVQVISPTFGTFIHEVTVRGDISSSKNIDIKCNVRSNQGTLLLWVIDEGKIVKKGDLLAVLDSSTLIDNKVSQESTCSSSEADVETAKNDLKMAEIAKKEYEEGTYLVNLQKLESAQIEAEEERSRLAEYLEHSKKLYQKGFITKQQLDADEFSLKKAELTLNAANLDIKVLKDYTFTKSSINYDSEIKTAQAKLIAKENTHRNNLAKLADTNQQIESCRVLAPSDGKVIYANETRGPSGSEFVVYEGVTIRERQTFLKLPDSSDLQVVADVHEGKINYIKVGMIAHIRTDATGDRDIRGTVIKVNDLPQPTNHWMGNVKEYRVTIKIDSSDGVLPGMTADTRIDVEKQDNVLMIPTHAVMEHGGKFYCILPTKSGYMAQELQLGSSNDKVVIVKSGLDRNSRILAAAFLNRDKVKLPALEPGQATSATIRTEVDSTHTVLDPQTVQNARQKGKGPNANGQRGPRPNGARGQFPAGGQFPGNAGERPQMPGAEGGFPMPRAEGDQAAGDGQADSQGGKKGDREMPPMPEGGEMPPMPEGGELPPMPEGGELPPPPDGGAGGPPPGGGAGGPPPM